MEPDPGRPWLPAFGNLAAGEVVTGILRLLALLWVARELGPADFGTVSVGFVVGGYLIVLAHPGLELVGTRAVATDPDAAPHWLGHIVGLRLLLGLVAYVLTVGVVAVLPIDDELRQIIVIIGLVIFTQALDVRWVFVGTQRTRAVAVASVVGAAVYLASVVALVHGPDDLLVVPVLYVVSQALISIVLVGASRRLGRWTPHLRRGSAQLTTFRESTPLTLAQVGRAFTVSFDVILVKILRPADEAGYYAAASRLAVVGLVYLGLYYTALLPSMVRAAQAGPDELRAMTRVGARRALLFGTPLLAVGLAVTPVLVPALLGDEYEQTAGLFQILLVALFLVGFNGIINDTLIASGRERVFAVLVGVSVVVNVVANLVLLATVGVAGAAIATVVTEALTLLLGALALRRASPRGTTPRSERARP
jgi:O-antigen/teichoic acid export membrane protein